MFPDIFVNLWLLVVWLFGWFIRHNHKVCCEIRVFYCCMGKGYNVLSLKKVNDINVPPSYKDIYLVTVRSKSTVSATGWIAPMNSRDRLLH